MLVTYYIQYQDLKPKDSGEIIKKNTLLMNEDKRKKIYHYRKQETFSI